jgi:hypothetical protein
MAKHVYPPFTVGVADSSSVHLTLDVNRVITAFTLFGGSGGDFGVANTSSRSDHTHVTVYDSRYILRGGDTVAGNYVHSGNMSVGGTLGVTGATTLTAAATINATLHVIGLATLDAGLTITSGGAAITGNVTLTSGVFSTTTKGSLFGQSTGGNTALTQANAAILFYANSANNWAGMGADNSGGVWIRTGLSGTPDFRTYWDGSGGMTHSGAAAFSSTVSVTGALTVSGGIFATKSGANITIDTPSTGQQGELWFHSAGVSKWLIYKTTANDIAIWNVALSRNEMQLLAAGGARFAVLAGTSGYLVSTTDTFGTIGSSAPSAMGSSMVLLYTGSSGSVASFSLPNNTFSSTYSHYLIKMSGVTLSTSVQALFWRGRTSGTDDSGANAYKSSGSFISVAGTQLTFGTSATIGYILPAQTSATITDISLSLWVHDPADASYYTMVLSQFYGIWNGADWYAGWGGGMYNASKKAHDSITLVPGSGNFSFGKIEVWGFRKV